MFRLRMVGKIIRQAGLGHITVVFLVIFFLCAVIVKLTDPAVQGWGDALWLCFQTVATIGFGDVAALSHITRVVLVVLSIISLFYLAVITGVVVSYCNQLVQANTKGGIAHMAQQLDHLEDLSHEELASLSKEIRAFKQARP